MITHPFRSILGPIPDSWEVVPLRAVVAKSSAGDWGDDRGGVGVRVVRSTNFTNDRILDLSDVATRWFPPEQAARFAMRSGDLLIERSGGGPTQPVGRVVRVDGDLGFGFSNFVQLLRIDEDAMSPDFVGWCLYQLHQSGVIERLQHQTTQMRNLDFRDYMSILLPKPPRGEQNHIAAAISVANRARSASYQHLKATRDVTTALVRELLLDEELAHPRKPLALHHLPADWRAVPLGKLVRSYQLGTDDVAEPNANAILMLKMADLDFGFLDISNAEFVSEYKAHLLDQYQLVPGDFLFNTRNTPELVGKSAVWRGEHPRAVFNNNILRLRFDESMVLPEYMELEFSSWRGRRRSKALAVGTTSVAAIYWQALRRCMIPIPPLPYQREAIAAIHCARTAERTVAGRLAAIQGVRTASLQHLLTGRVRVVEAATV